jgi:hypothetical protein
VVRCVDHPGDRQLDVGWQHLEESTATTEQHRDLVDELAISSVTYVTNG